MTPPTRRPGAAVPPGPVAAPAPVQAPATVREVLAGVPGIDEADVAAMLSHALARAPLAVSPSQPDLDFLAAHGDPETRERARSMTPAVMAVATARVAARASLFAAASTLSRDEMADVLGVDPNTVSTRVRRGQLMQWDVGARGARYPSWQVLGGHPLPHLRQVLGAVPDGVHPREVTALMTAEDDDLDGLTPARWLADGHDPAPVIDAVRSLGRE